MLDDCGSPTCAWQSFAYTVEADRRQKTEWDATLYVRSRFYQEKGMKECHGGAYLLPYTHLESRRGCDAGYTHTYMHTYINEVIVLY